MHRSSLNELNYTKGINILKNTISIIDFIKSLKSVKNLFENDEKFIKYNPTTITN